MSCAQGSGGTSSEPCPELSDVSPAMESTGATVAFVVLPPSLEPELEPESEPEPEPGPDPGDRVVSVTASSLELERPLWSPPDSTLSVRPPPSWRSGDAAEVPLPLPPPVPLLPWSSSPLPPPPLPDAL